MHLPEERECMVLFSDVDLFLRINAEQKAVLNKRHGQNFSIVFHASNVSISPLETRDPRLFYYLLEVWL